LRDDVLNITASDQRERRSPYRAAARTGWRAMPSFDLVQSRSANKVNEITGISNTTGTAWATPSYDAAGNMTGLPDAGESTPVGSNPAWVPLVETQWNTLTEAQWSAMTETYSSVPEQMQAQYGAWNRLVSVRGVASPIVEKLCRISLDSKRLGYYPCQP
ncbi:MAG: hypothetical protein R3C20_03970, partial [Planctomycetaceae bacterium]